MLIKLKSRNIITPTLKWTSLVAANARDMWVQSLGQEDPLGEGNGNIFQYSCQGNPMDRGLWRATLHGVARVRHDLATKLQPTSLHPLFRAKLAFRAGKMIEILKYLFSLIINTIA